MILFPTNAVSEEIAEKYLCYANKPIKCIISFNSPDIESQFQTRVGATFLCQILYNVTGKFMDWPTIIQDLLRLLIMVLVCMLESFQFITLLEHTCGIVFQSQLLYVPGAIMEFTAKKTIFIDLIICFVSLCCNKLQECFYGLCNVKTDIRE